MCNKIFERKCIKILISVVVIMSILFQHISVMAESNLYLVNSNESIDELYGKFNIDRNKYTINEKSRIYTYSAVYKTRKIWQEDVSMDIKNNINKYVKYPLLDENENVVAYIKPILTDIIEKEKTKDNFVYSYNIHFEYSVNLRQENNEIKIPKYFRINYNFKDFQSNQIVNPILLADSRTVKNGFSRTLSVETKNKGTNNQNVQQGIIDAIVKSVSNAYSNLNEFCDNFGSSTEPQFSFEPDPLPEPEQVTYTPIPYDFENDISNNSKLEYIKDLYMTVLGREEDSVQDSDIEYWFDSNLGDLTVGIIFSDESKAHNNLDKMSNENFVKLAYRAILGREPRAEDVTAYAKDLAEGKYTKENMIRSFVNSTEFLLKRYDSKVDFIKYLYKNVVNRELSQADLEVAIRQDTEYIAKSLMDSEAALSNGVDFNNMDNGNFIKFLYYHLLGRNAQDSEIQLISEYLDEGYLTRDTTLNFIITSEEFIVRRKSYVSDVVKDKKDKPVNISEDSKKLYIRDLYHKVLNRYPTNEQVEQYAKRTIQQATIDILYNREDIKKTFDNPKVKEELIRYLYKVILGRTDSEINDDIDGLAYHTSNINTQEASKRNVIRNLVQSAEFFDKRNREVSTITLNEKLCDAVYNNLLNQSIEIWKTSNTTLKLYKDDLESVVVLSISGKDISDLTGLSAFTNLKQLSANNNKIKDVSAIANLTNLTSLDLSNNSIGDSVNSLKTLTNLKELNLDKNGLTSSNINEVFTQLTNLEKLSLSGNSLTNVPNLKGLNKLNDLNLSNNVIKNIKNLDNVSVENLNLKNNAYEYTDANKSANLPVIIKEAKNSNSKLYTTQAYECTDCMVADGKLVLNSGKRVGTVKVKGGIADGSSFKYTDNSVEISFKDVYLANKLREQLGARMKFDGTVDGVQKYRISQNNLDSVKNLNLSSSDENKISDISGLGQFKNLESVDLSGNDILLYGELGRLKNLKSLKVRHCNLTNLSSIVKAVTLTQLDASNNNITDISDIENLTYLEDVVLSNNDIKDISPLNKLEHLKNLSIANNNLSSLSGLNGKRFDFLNISYNKLTSFNGIDVGNTKNIEMKSNNAILTANMSTKTVAIPDMLARTISENGGVSSLKFEDCGIVGNNIKLNDGEISGRITVLKGRYKDSVIDIYAEKDVTPPELTVSYQKNDQTGAVDVVITSNEELRDWTSGYELMNGNKVLKKTYAYNTEESVRVFDLQGNSTLQQVRINNIINKKIPGLTVSYSEYGPTKNDVVVTVKADVALGNPNEESMRWIQSEDRKTLTRSFLRYEPVILHVQTEANYVRLKEIDELIAGGASAETYAQEKAQLLANQVPIEFEVFNVDIRQPSCYVEYSSEEMGTSSVRATIWSDEDISLVNANKKATKISRLNNSGYAEYGLVLYYSENKTEQLEVKDKAGNITIVNIAVNNIDNQLDGLSLTVNGSVYTNQNVSVKATANEKISGSVKATNIATRMIREKYNNAVMQARLENGDYRVAAVSLFGESDIGAGIRLAKGNSEDDLQEGLQDELTYDYSENASGVLSFYDAAGNVDTTTFNVNMIDKQNPKISNEAYHYNDDGTITVTLDMNKELKPTEELVGWEFNEDRTTLTKTFSNNTKETLRFEDLAGNSIEYIVNVEGVKVIPYAVLIVYQSEIDKYFVQIATEKKIKPVNGWDLSDDKMRIGRFMNPGEFEKVLIEDYDGNGSEVNIEVEDNNKADNESETEEHNDVIDTTIANKELPQTGKYIFCVLTVLIVLIVLEYVSYLSFKNDL